MKTFAALTIAGVTGLVVLKLLASMVFPLIAFFLGLLVLGVKLAVVAAVVWFAYNMLRRGRNGAAA